MPSSDPLFLYPRLYERTTRILGTVLRWDTPMDTTENAERHRIASEATSYIVLHLTIIGGITVRSNPLDMNDAIASYLRYYHGKRQN